MDIVYFSYILNRGWVDKDSKKVPTYKDIVGAAGVRGGRVPGGYTGASTARTRAGGAAGGRGGRAGGHGAAVRPAGRADLLDPRSSDVGELPDHDTYSR